ncbi:MAG: hypothetical protein ACR2PR_11600 [Pseudohongiellaceae bacterium]
MNQLFDEDLIEEALGAEGLDDNAKKYIEEFNFRVELADSFFHTFNEGPGRLVLNHLFHTCVLSPTVIEGESAEAHGIREGKKRVVMLILEIMQRARTGDYNVS